MTLPTETNNIWIPFRLPLSPLVPGCSYSSFEETVLKDGFWIVLEQIANKTTTSGIPRDKKTPGVEEESS